MTLTERLGTGSAPEDRNHETGEGPPDEPVEGEGAAAEPETENPDARDSPAGEAHEDPESQPDAGEPSLPEDVVAASIEGNGEPKEAEFPPIEPGIVDDEGNGNQDEGSGDAPVRRH